MKKLLGLLSMVVLNVGCGIVEDNRLPQFIDEEFYSYVDEFEQITNIAVDSSVEFERIDNEEHPSAVGLCYNVENGRNQVVIDVDFWETADETTRRALISHELVHCEYGLGHVETRDESGSFTLMGPNVHGSAACIREKGLEQCIADAINHKH